MITQDTKKGTPTEYVRKAANRVQLEDYIDARTLCEQLAICGRTLDRWHRLRIGPPRVRAGKKILYRKSAVAEWLKNQEAGVKVGRDR